MSSDDAAPTGEPDDEASGDGTTPEDDGGSPADIAPEGLSEARERIEESAGAAVDGFDESVVDLLAWLLDTETRARIYVYLRREPDSTSSEVADGTGLYPSTVREALAELAEEETVTRLKRENDGAGNNPYEYRAIPPSELVAGAVEGVQEGLNTLFELGDRDADADEPVTITIDGDDDE